MNVCQCTFAANCFIVILLIFEVRSRKLMLAIFFIISLRLLSNLCISKFSSVTTTLVFALFIFLGKKCYLLKLFIY